MGSTCVVGLQWGDEAKGKIVDLLCDQHDVVVRYQGGANAGHTVVARGRDLQALAGADGDPPAGDRLRHRQRRGDPPPRPAQGDRDPGGAGGRRRRPAAHQRPGPRHPAVSPGRGAADRGIGLDAPTTSAPPAAGIGPCYRDKVGRVHGVRVADLYHPAPFRERLARIIDYKNRLLAAMLPDFDPLDAGAVAEEYLGYAERLRPFVRDTTAWLHRAVERGRRLLFEGAQGSLLDIDHGSYPYVTSSNSSAAGIAAGSGVPDPAHRSLDRRRQGVHDPRRRRPVPHRAGQRRPASGSDAWARNTAR